MQQGKDKMLNKLSKTFHMSPVGNTKNDRKRE